MLGPASAWRRGVGTDGPAAVVGRVEGPAAPPPSPPPPTGSWGLTSDCSSFPACWMTFSGHVHCHPTRKQNPACQSSIRAQQETSGRNPPRARERAREREEKEKDKRTSFPEIEHLTHTGLSSSHLCLILRQARQPARLRLNFCERFLDPGGGGGGAGGSVVVDEEVRAWLRAGVDGPAGGEVEVEGSG